MIRVAKRVREWRRSGKKVMIATVVGAEGSSPRDLGSMMAVSEDGEIAGSVSAGCAEGSVLGEALRVMESDAYEKGVGSLLSFSSEEDKAWEVGSPCGGDIEVLLQPYVDDVHDRMMELASEGAAFTSVLFLDGEGPFAGCQAVLSEDGRSAGAWMEQFILDEALDVFEGMRREGVRAAKIAVAGGTAFACSYDARFTIVCVGAVHISSCLARIARELDYRVVIVDPRAALLNEDRFVHADELVRAWPQKAFSQLSITGQTAVCVLTHDGKIDVPALIEALRTDAFYIGCLGHAETLAQRRAEVLEQGVDERQLGRVFGPIGAYIGGRAPAEIALSIMAQIQAVRYGRIAFPDEMPGHRLDEFTDEAVSAIASKRREGEGRRRVSYTEVMRELEEARK